jgi:hypothetical protein
MSDYEIRIFPGGTLRKPVVGKALIAPAKERARQEEIQIARGFVGDDPTVLAKRLELLDKMKREI